jgi:hypothetical protein
MKKHAPLALFTIVCMAACNHAPAPGPAIVLPIAIPALGTRSPQYTLPLPDLELYGFNLKVPDTTSVVEGLRSAAGWDCHTLPSGNTVCFNRGPFSKNYSEIQVVVSLNRRITGVDHEKPDLPSVQSQGDANIIVFFQKK